MVVIGMILFPGLTQLDLTGPYEVFTRVAGAKVLLVAETKDAIKADSGLAFTSDYSFEEAPQLDILCVPGGKGVFDAMQNAKLVQFLQQQGEHAKYVTSVCTGALILAAAGLLVGFLLFLFWLL